MLRYLLIACLFFCVSGLLARQGIEDVLDAEGKLKGYCLIIDVESESGKRPRSVNGTMYWNLAGLYLRFEPDAGNPLRKRNGVPFTAEDHSQLDKILRDRDSLLGHHSLAWLGDPEGSDPAPDGISGATPKTLQRAVVQDAAWTSWILWQHANVTHVDDLQRMTRERAAAGLYAQLLGSVDLSECVFGLQLLKVNHVPGDEYLDLVLAALIRGDNEIIRSAIRYLDQSVQDRPLLMLELAQACGQMNPGYVPMVVRYLEKQPQLNTEVLEQLSRSLPQLPAVSVRMILELINSRGCYTDEVLKNVTVIKETGSVTVAHLAEAFLDNSNGRFDRP